MADNRQRESIDDAMLALRERLKLVSEKLRKSREASNDVLKGVDLSRRARVAPEVPGISSLDYIPARLPADQWPDFLRKLSIRLEAVMGGTEEDFLAIGANLHEFQKLAGRISETSGYVARLITDRQISKNIDELKWVISKMREWLYSPEAETGMSREYLNARMLVDKTGICLNTLENKYGRSEYILKELTDRTGEIEASISSVIESLQYNDITRQQVAHIKKEVEGLEAQLAQAGFGGTLTDLSGLRDAAGEAGGICFVLASELREAAAGFERAVRTVSESLLLVSRDAAEMSEDIMQVVKGDSESGKSFMSAIGNWLSSLTDTLSAFGGSGESCGQGEPGMEVPEEFGRMVGELCVIVESLRKVNGNILYRLSLMEDDSKVLSSDVESAVEHFGSNARVAGMVEGVAAGLDKIADEARAISPDGVVRHSVLARGRFRANTGLRPAGLSREESQGKRDRGAAGGDDNVELF